MRPKIVHTGPTRRPDAFVVTGGAGMLCLQHGTANDGKPQRYNHGVHQRRRSGRAAHPDVCLSVLSRTKNRRLCTRRRHSCAPPRRLGRAHRWRDSRRRMGARYRVFALQRLGAFYLSHLKMRHRTAPVTQQLAPAVRAGLAADARGPGSGAGCSTRWRLGPWGGLALAVIAVVSVEQLFRHAAANDRQIKLLCLSLAGLFLFDIYFFTHTLIFQSVDSLLAQSRATVSLTACLFMAMGGLLLAQRVDSPANLALSRPIAFYTTSLVVVGMLITVLALGGYYVRLYGGNWGTVIYSLILAGAVLLITSAFVSTTIRSRLSVLINKHLFRHKYDYRNEWLRLINYLAQPAERDEVNRRA